MCSPACASARVGRGEVAARLARGAWRAPTAGSSPPPSRAGRVAGPELTRTRVGFRRGKRGAAVFTPCPGHDSPPAWRGRWTPRAFIGGESGGKGKDGRVIGGAPLPFPTALGVGLSCAVDGAKAAVVQPSDAWKPLTAATLAVAVALDAAGIYAAGRVLSPDADAGMITAVVSKLILVAVDGVWVLVAPIVAIAVVQQVLPLLSERILFDALKAATGTKAPASEDGTAATARWNGEDEDDDVSESSASSSRPFNAARAARVEQLEASAGLGFRGLGAAASRAKSLAGLGFAAAPVGLGLSLVPGVGPIAGGALATTIAAYTLAWELLDPYFDKAELNFEEQERVMWNNRFALTAFAFPFAAALAVPIVGPLSVAVAQGATAELVWRVLEPEE